MMGTSDDVNRSAPRSWRWTVDVALFGAEMEVGSALVEVDRRGASAMCAVMSARRSLRRTAHLPALVVPERVGCVLLKVDRTVRASAKRQARAAMACMTSVKTRPVPIWVDINLQWPAEDPLTANIRPAPALGDEGWALICGNGLQRAALSRQRAAGHISCPEYVPKLDAGGRRQSCDQG